MRRALKTGFISLLFTILILGFEHFSPIPRVSDRAKNCCGELAYDNRHGFPFLLREDVSGGIAPAPPQTIYYVGNYIKLGSIIFIGSTLIQLVIITFKKRYASS